MADNPTKRRRTEVFDVLPAGIQKAVFGDQVYTPDERNEFSDKFTTFINQKRPTEAKSLCIDLGKVKQIEKKHKPRHTQKKLPRRFKKALGLYSLNRNSIKYDEILPLNQLWKDYMSDYLGLEEIKNQGWNNDPDDKSFDAVSLKLNKADMHGCYMTVTRSNCPGYVGKSGIVAMDTKSCFHLVGKDNIVRNIPKSSCEFQFYIDEFEFSFYGKNFLIRPADRSTKKIKTIHSMDL